MKSLLIPLAAITCAAALIGCSTNSDVTGPAGPNDNVPPPAPTGLVIASQAEHHRLTWSPSTSPDVVRYEVYQYLPDPSRDNSYLMIGEAATNSFILALNQEDVDAHFRVRAVDTEGNRSASSEVFSTRLPAIELGGGGAGTVEPTGDPRIRINE